MSTESQPESVAQGILNKADIVYQRLHNQRLSSSKLKRPVDVVHWLGAVQAQDFNGAKWALGLRMIEATNAVIEEAYNEGKILRTHLMRPTWHFVAADDIRWLLQLTASRVNIKSGANYRKLELDDRTFKRCNKAITSALKREKHLTRAALRKVLNEAGVSAQDPVRLAHILLRAELDGVICSGPLVGRGPVVGRGPLVGRGPAVGRGPVVGRQFTYALLDERVPAMKTFNRDEALAKLTRRYFTSHGPATLQDFMWWSGLTALDAKNGIALVERHLTKASCDGQVYWGPPSVETLHRPPSETLHRPPSETLHRPSAYLLPAFDEYLVAYKDRTAVFELKDSLGIFGPTVIVNGKIAGSWKPTKSGEYSLRDQKDNKTMTITVKPFRPLRKSEKLAITKAADRYVKFFGLPPSINNFTHTR